MAFGYYRMGYHNQKIKTSTDTRSVYSENCDFKSPSNAHVLKVSKNSSLVPAGKFPGFFDICRLIQHLLGIQPIFAG